MSQLLLQAGSGAEADEEGMMQRHAALKVIKSPLDDIRLSEEFVHSAIHAFGILFGIAAIPLLTAVAVKYGNGINIAGACIYGFTFLLVFASSTFYHGFQHPAIKKMLEKLDHVSIYFFIAGTYTPLIFAYMNSAAGMIMLWSLWALVIAGACFKMYFGCRYNLLSTVVYLLMGWMLVFTGEDFFRAMPPMVIKLILGGGALYSLGVVFYLWEKPRWNHAVWHTLVLAAAVCHYIAIYKTVGG